MKKIKYFTKELKGNIDFTQHFDEEGKLINKVFTYDDFEMKPQTIQVEDSDLESYLENIKNCYSEFGEITIIEGETPQPTAEDYLIELDYRLSIIELGL